MNPSKLDKWPRYERARFVLVQRYRRYDRPWQGFVLTWKRERSSWFALVAYVDEREPAQIPHAEWFPVERLRPIYVDPNGPDREWF